MCILHITLVRRDAVWWISLMKIVKNIIYRNKSVKFYLSYTNMTLYTYFLLSQATNSEDFSFNSGRKIYCDKIT